MSWIVYELGPIDHGWENLKTVRETVADIAQNEDVLAQPHDLDGEAVRRFVDRWESAKDAAAAAGWEGDFRHPPRVFWLPYDISFEYGFVFKQDNNGTTYVVSPQDLPTLAQLVTQ